MQNCKQTMVRQTILLSLAFFGVSFTCRSQDSLSADELYRSRIELLFRTSDALCKADSTSKLASSWMMKANSLSGIMDDAQLKEQHKNLNLQTEYAMALHQILKFDKKGEFRGATENSLAVCVIDLCNLGLNAMTNARQYRSEADAEQAVAWFNECLEGYKACGQGQALVHDYWRSENLGWQWIQFYKAVSNRMANNLDEAGKEYQVLLKLGWKEPVLFLEAADLQAGVGKAEDAEKILLNAHTLHPENAAIACALTRIYLKNDKLKKAQKLIKPFDNVLGNNFEVALTKALVYERKGDLKKADALMKAVLKADANEVIINQTYAEYLLRKASSSDKLDAEEFSQLAYNLLDKALEMSPNNDNLRVMLADTKAKYPKVYKEDAGLVAQ